MVCILVFFVMVASIMAICIISIYKIARKMGGDLSLSALVMCGISALIINFMAIQTNPFLTKAYYYILGSMIIFAASGVTCYNKYLLYRHNQPTAHGAVHDSMNMVANDAIAESEERIEEKPAEDMLFSSAEEPASNEAATGEQTALSEPSSVETLKDAESAADNPVPAKAVTDEQSATSEPASTEVVTEAEPAAETLTANAPASKAASPISETEPRPEAAETAKAAETFEPEEAMLKAAPEPIASSKEAKAEPISDALEKAETEQAQSSSDAESESSTGADIADSEAAPTVPEPEAEQKDAPQPEPAKAVLPDGLESMDDLLDFAFAQASAEHYAMALLAYSTALEKYRNDDYAPFIIIDMVNLYKSQGQYQAAIDCINEAMDIPAIKANPAYQQNFQNYLAQIESISHSAASPKVP